MELRARGRERKYAAWVVGGKVDEDLFNRGLCLPSGTAMTGSDLDRIISIIGKCYWGRWESAGINRHEVAGESPARGTE